MTQTDSKQRKALKKKKKKKTRRIPLWAKFLLIPPVLILIFLCVLYGSGIGGKVDHLRLEAKSFVHTSTEETFRASQTSSVYDANDQLISTLSGEKNLYYLEFDDIPTYVKTAFVSIEDKKFYSHSGVDYKAVLRAFLSLVKNGEITQGGSTITQQLSRNIFLSHEVSWERKVEEIFISRYLEKKYSKNEILEYYINNIYFANGNYGIQAASKGYFNTDVHELSLSQTAFLCAIPNNPTLYNPLEHMDNTLKRRDRILKQMYEDSIISRDDYNQALHEEITLNIPTDKKSNYVETYVYYCATRAIMEENGFEFRYSFQSDKERESYDEAYNSAYANAQKSLFTAGYKIYTSIDMTMQDKLQTAVDTQLADFTDLSDEGVYKLQASAVCVDNNTGYVTAIVGGRTQDFTGYTLNRAYQSYRQPGSAIKPLIVYTPALERGYTASSIVSDTKIKDGPSNSGDTYEGDITLRRAVAKSKNTVAWNLFAEITPKKGLAYLTEMDFSKIVDDDYYLPSALGGFTKGTSAVEMAGGYAALANNGMFRSPTCVKRITDASGNVIWQSGQTGSQVYKKNAALAMTDLLQSVMTEGTGKNLGLEQMPSAGKTGTTNDNKDGWFAGYTPYYTTAVWVGYDLPQKLTGLQGASYPGKIWQQFMNSIHEGLEYKEFAKVKTTTDENSSGDQKEPASAPAVAPAPSPEPEKSSQPTHTPAPAASGTPKPTGRPQPEETPTPPPKESPAPENRPAVPEVSEQPQPTPDSNQPENEPTVPDNDNSSPDEIPPNAAIPAYPA